MDGPDKDKEEIVVTRNALTDEQVDAHLLASGVKFNWDIRVDRREAFRAGFAYAASGVQAAGLVAALAQCVKLLDQINPPSGPFWSGADVQERARALVAETVKFMLAGTEEEARVNAAVKRIEERGFLSATERRLLGLLSEATLALIDAPMSKRSMSRDVLIERIHSEIKRARSFA